jgi:hypothetical protein
VRKFRARSFRFAPNSYPCVAKYGLNLSPFFYGQLQRSWFVAID